jgi:hypothetical protein
MKPKEQAMSVPELSKNEALRKINDILEAYSLPQWELSRLGDIASGKCEIIDMKDVTEITDKRIEITVRMLTPAGDEVDIRIRIGGTVHYVIPYLSVTEKNLVTNHYVGLVKRWRVEHGEWSFELPRGLVFKEQHSAETDAFDSPSHQVLKDTFGNDCLEHLSAAKIMPVGEMTMKWENRNCEAYMIIASVNQPFRRKQGDGELVLLQWHEVLALIDKGRYITDLGTIAVLLRAARSFQNLSETK